MPTSTRSDLKIGKVFTFDTNADAILGTSVINAKLIAICDYSTALTYENIDLKFRTIYPLLPIGTPDAPEACEYFIFKSESNQVFVLADQWINMGSIVVVDNIKIQVMLNTASVSDITVIRDALNSYGFINYTITVVT